MQSKDYAQWRRCKVVEERNVADMLRERFQADVIECSLDDDKKVIHCRGELNPDFEKGMSPDWTVDVDTFGGHGLTRFHLYQFQPQSEDSIEIVPAGGRKTCMLEHGNGIGTVNLICVEDPSQLDKEIRRWPPDQMLKDKGLIFKLLK